MGANNKLRIGDVSDNGQITIIDEDRLCYLVKSVSKGAVGLRTISKALLDEFVVYMRQYPEVPANEVRFKISGQSDIDKFDVSDWNELAQPAKFGMARAAYRGFCKTREEFFQHCKEQVIIDKI